MAFQVNGTEVITDSRHFKNLGELQIPSGNTSSRPGSPAVGTLYHNTETDEIEAYMGIPGTGSYTTILNSDIQVWKATSSFKPDGAALDTDYGILFGTASNANAEKMSSTDGNQYRVSYNQNIGWLAGSGNEAYQPALNTVNISNLILPSDGSSVSGIGAVAFTYQGIAGNVLIERFTPGSDSNQWVKVGAY